MNKNITDTIEIYLGKPKEDIVVLLSALHSDLFKTKSEARSAVQQYYDDNDIQVVKAKTKKESIIEWYLSQPEPTKVTKDEIKKECVNLDMKGGSVEYYATALTLASTLHKQLTK